MPCVRSDVRSMLARPLLAGAHSIHAPIACSAAPCGAPSDARAGQRTSAGCGTRCAAEAARGRGGARQAARPSAGREEETRGPPKHLKVRPGVGSERGIMRAYEALCFSPAVPHAVCRARPPLGQLRCRSRSPSTRQLSGHSSPALTAPPASFLRLSSTCLCFAP